MPYSAPSLCAEPGCGELTLTNRCDEHRTERRREADRRRPNGTQRGYTREWAQFSRDFLQRHPLCECDNCRHLEPWRRPDATDVDHMGGHSRTCPHAYDERHLQALSHTCHSRKTATEDGSFGRTPTTRCTG